MEESYEICCHYEGFTVSGYLWTRAQNADTMFGMVGVQLCRYSYVQENDSEVCLH